MINRPEAIEKYLSKNDSGETGGHQAGILIPKQSKILSFFPELNIDEKNPRLLISFKDQFGEIWQFSFIYYNNKFFNGTRNEYRLTGMTRYMNAYNLKSGDIIRLSRDKDDFYYITYLKSSNSITDTQPLKLTNSWKVITIK
jgi:hypothetical protein